MGTNIEPATEEKDIRAAYKLVQALAIHENTADYFKIREMEFVAAASGDQPQFHILLARLDDDIVAVATYFRRFHIWNGGNIFVLDDLFVHPTARGQGIGTLLLNTLGAKAKAEDVPVKWQVSTENKNALALYERLGASHYTSGICWWKPENIR